MRAGLYLRYMARESRGQRRRLAFFVACLAVGVAAVVAVAGLAASLDAAIRTEARQLLAADLAVSGAQMPPQEDLEAVLDSYPGTEYARVKELVTVVATPAGKDGAAGASQLVELKAVEGGYPFYGRLDVEPALLERTAGRATLGEILNDTTAVAAPGLLTSLGIEAGDRIKVGQGTFRIGGVLLSEPDRLSGAFTLGPRLFLSLEGLERAELEGLGSRVQNRVLVKLPVELDRPALDDLEETLEETLDTTFRVETYAEAQPALRRGLDRAERFLGLVALLSLLAGGIGVAQTVRAYLAGRMDSIAILKCLGLKPREVLALYLGQTALLGFIGSLVGIALGVGVELLIPRVLSVMVPTEAINPFLLTPILRGLALGVGVAVLFSLAPLATVLRVPPARVLRRGAEPLPAARRTAVATALALALGVLALATFQSGSLRLGAGFTAGLAAATALLAASAVGLTRLAGRASRRLREGRLALSQGLAALARPGSGTLGAIVALGLGVLVVLAMSVVERQLSAQFEADLPTGAPNVFLINIQPEQWPGVEELLQSEEAESLNSVPVVTARLAAVEGRPVTEIAEERREQGGRTWALTREQQITYLDALPEDNRILEGELWSRPDEGELSVEQEFAEWLQVEVGSVLTFDIQGVPVDLTVTSIREVNWESFAINFYLVAEPGYLDDAPQQRIAALRLPRGEEQRVQNRLVAAYPNITLFNIREILEKVGKVIQRVGLGVRLLGGFTVLAGIAILAGAVTAASGRRGREVALLKTLGMTRAGVVSVFSVEYTLIGLAAGLIGTLGGGLLAWMVLTRGMELLFRLDARPYLAALVGTVVLSVVAGLAASLGALAKRPVEVLRGE